MMERLIDGLLEKRKISENIRAESPLPILSSFSSPFIAFLFIYFILLYCLLVMMIEYSNVVQMWASV